MHPFLAAALLLPLAVMPTPASADLLKWPDLTNRTKPTADATIAYGTDQMQKVDIWLPKARPGEKGPFPVVVMVHGGCWTTSIADRSLMNWIADDLRNDGVAVWNIDYRGVDRTGGGYPGTFADAATATDQLAVNAKRFNLDTRTSWRSATRPAVISRSGSPHDAGSPRRARFTQRTHFAFATSSVLAVSPISKPPRPMRTMAAAPRSSRSSSARPPHNARMSMPTPRSRASSRSA